MLSDIASRNYSEVRGCRNGKQCLKSRLQLTFKDLKNYSSVQDKAYPSSCIINFIPKPRKIEPVNKRNRRSDFSFLMIQSPIKHEVCA